MSVARSDIKKGPYVNEVGNVLFVHTIAKSLESPERMVFYTYKPLGAPAQNEDLYLRVGSFQSELATKGYKHCDDICKLVTVINCA